MKEYLWKLKNAILSSIARQTIGVRCIMKNQKIIITKCKITDIGSIFLLMEQLGYQAEINQ